jgi:hypothetical protein
MMHAVTYRTALLQRMGYKQSEGIAYTDEEWIFLPMVYVKTIAFINADVYQYLHGRPGQTMDPVVFYRSITHLKIRLLRIMEYYYSFNRETLSQPVNIYLFHKLKANTRFYYDVYLLQQWDEKVNLDELKSFDAALRENHRELYEILAEERVHERIPVKHIRYFRKHAKRLPSCFRYIIDIVHVLAEIKRRIFLKPFHI